MKPPRRLARAAPRPLAPFDAAALLVTAEYEDFLTRPTDHDPADPRNVAARHAAGRAILVHLEQIQKITRLLAPPAEPTGPATALARARHEIAQTPEPEEDPEADDLAGHE